MSVVNTHVIMPITPYSRYAATNKWALMDKATRQYCGLVSEYVMDDAGVCTSARMVSDDGETLEMFGVEQADIDAWITEHTELSGAVLFTGDDQNSYKCTEAGFDFLQESRAAA